jgi:hypothetical protein
MRKISILDESYMALEGNIAESIDKADSKVDEVKTQIKTMLDELMSQVQNKANPAADPAVVNFRNDPNASPMVGMKVISEMMVAAIEAIKDRKVMSLEEVAQVSKAYAALVGLTADSYNDEVEEAVYFFGRENTDIPDSEKNVFIVQISDAAKQKAIERLVQVQGFLAKASNDAVQFLTNGTNPEGLYSSMETLSLIKLLLDPFVSNKA